MTKGCKIWLWIIFIGNVLATILCLPLIFKGLLGIYCVAASVIEVVGIALMLFKKKKNRVLHSSCCSCTQFHCEYFIYPH